MESISVARFSGHLRLRAERRADERTVLAQQSFRAPYHLSKPYWDPEARVLLVQVVNPTAGILAGDHLESEVGVGPGAALHLTTPSASRVFKMENGAIAECCQKFSVAAAGWLEVSPEPLVPHRGSRYRQITRIDVEPGGALFFVDPLMPGRVGHGEAWLWDSLVLDLDVRFGGELILRERLDQTGDSLRALAELAGSGPAACFANALLIAGSASSASPVAPESAPWRDSLAALHRDGVWLGVSALRRGGWSFKLVAPDAIRLRQTLREMRQLLAAYFPSLRSESRKL